MRRTLFSFFLQNTTTRQTIFKNATWLFLGTIVSRLARAAVLMYAARILGARDWGAFNYALSLAAFFTIFTDFGVNAVLTRESAKDTNQQERYFSSAFFIKLAAGLFIAIALIVLFPMFSHLIISSSADIPLVSVLIPIVVLIVLFDSMRDFGAALSRAWEKMQIESVVQMLTNALIVVFGIGALLIIPTAQSLSWGYAIGTGIGMIAAFFPFRRYFKTLFSYISFSAIKKMLSASWPFGMMGLMGVVMLNTDSLMIGWFLNIEQVGYYGAGQRVAQLLYAIPSLIAVAFFPALAKKISNLDAFNSLISLGSRTLMLIALPLTIGGVVLAEPLLTFIYGQSFRPGVDAFILIQLTYIPVFLSALLGNTLFAIGKERKLLGYVLCGILGNAFFNILFIPSMGIAGAALSTVVNQLIATSYLLILMKNHRRYAYSFNFSKIVYSSLGMGACVTIGLLFEIHTSLLLLFGIISYGLLLFLFKEPLIAQGLAFYKKSAQ